MKGDNAAAVILAGGRSRRFEGRVKALVHLHEKPLIEHVIERISPQVKCIALSVEHTDDALQYLGLEQIEDPQPGAQGPLQALLAALQWLKANEASSWLQLAPCDTPFLPADLSSRLMTCAQDRGLPGAVPTYDQQLQPACGLWHVELEGGVGKAVEAGKKGIKEFLQAYPLAVCEWMPDKSGIDPFLNINTAADLELAHRLPGV